MEVKIKDVQISLQEYQGNKYLDIRKFWWDKIENKSKPGKGITLSSMETIEGVINAINEHKEEIKNWVKK